MPEWVQNIIVVVIVLCVVIGVVSGMVISHQRNAAYTRQCMEAGYGDWFHYAPTKMPFCIGVIDGEWRIKPIPTEDLDR